jgi:hypothetical protein
MPSKLPRLLTALTILLPALLLAATEVRAAPTVYPHIVDLSTVPSSQGNGTLFTGSVCWIGILGSGPCFPGYENDVSQAIFKQYTIPPASNWQLSYRYRADSETNADVTSVIIDRSGQCPALQSTGFYAFTSLPSERDVLASYSGGVEGIDQVDLSSYAGQTVCVVVNSVSNATGSDADCGWDSLDGLFEIDDLQVDMDLTTFDAGANGWTFAAIGPLDIVAIPATTSVGNMVLVIAFVMAALYYGRRKSASV